MRLDLLHLEIRTTNLLSRVGILEAVDRLAATVSDFAG